MDIDCIYCMLELVSFRINLSAHLCESDGVPRTRGGIERAAPGYVCRESVMSYVEQMNRGPGETSVSQCNGVVIDIHIRVSPCVHVHVHFPSACAGLGQITPSRPNAARI